MPTDKQRGVIGGMATGLGVTIAVLAGAIVAAPDALLPADDVLASLAHALAWGALPVACLAGNIGRLAAHRFFTPADIDGGATSDGTSGARLLQSTLQNTLEQTVLALATYAIWGATAPRTWQAAIAAAAVLFVIGRVLFWRGCARGAPARALGFALTFYPSIGMLLMLGARFVYRLVA
ncbi:MAG TPA: MAPEG family protein [Rhodanobacteraceae bacterium]